MLEGLVQVIPRKGVMVQTVSLDQVLKILDARLVNEPYCAGLAAERATSGEISRMQALLASAGLLIRASRSRKADESRSRISPADFRRRAKLRHWRYSY